MSKPLTRSEPVPAAAFMAKGIVLSLAQPMNRYSLRARSAVAVAMMLGRDAPDRIGDMRGGLACLGPDEWLLRTPPEAPLAIAEAMAVAVTDISERSLCLIVEGPRAAAILETGCPLDLHHFAVGRATRTIFETVEIILIRESDHCFHVEVWRSFAPWLWTALTTAAGNSVQ